MININVFILFKYYFNNSKVLINRVSLLVNGEKPVWKMIYQTIVTNEISKKHTEIIFRELYTEISVFTSDISYFAKIY